MKLQFFPLSLCFAFIVHSAPGMEIPQPAPISSTFSRQVMRVNHSVATPGISHYSLFRAYSVSTYIDNESDILPDVNYYLVRTISKFPKEGIKEIFSGTKELPLYKISRARTGSYSYEDKIELRAVESSVLSPEIARNLFKNCVLDHELIDKPVEIWLDEIQQMQMPLEPIACSDRRAAMIKTDPKCNILS